MGTNLKAGLYLLSTPIGNRGDITIRTLEILKECDLIVAEDTRVARKLLSMYQISLDGRNPTSYSDNSNSYARRKLVESICNGKSVALISDAGTPGISDPGFLLIRECIKNNIEIECLPGATALIPALVNSGLPSDRFLFEGFLPVKKGRTKRLKELSTETRTMVFYESPHRILKTLNDFSNYFNVESQISVSRELTKLYEETFRGTIKESVEHFEKNKTKGEFVIVLSPK